MAVVSMRALLETGVHFGHRTSKWNPQMKSYIFTERNGIHIIDLQQTLEALNESYALVRDTVADGGIVLFVGTKRQAQETIQVEAERCGMPYVNARWLGGTLTNWSTIRSRIDELKALERRRDEGEFDLLTKKEALMLNRKIDKLEERLGGIREMRRVPDLLYVVDVKREETAVHEANLLEIPVVALVDTNCDPGNVDFVIPSNDDAIRAIKLLTSTFADAVLEGVNLRKDIEEEEQVADRAGAGADEDFEDMTDEELLGEATLAKIQSGAYGEEQAESDEDEDDKEGEKDEGDAAEDSDEHPPDEEQDLDADDGKEDDGEDGEGADEDVPDGESESDDDEHDEDEDEEESDDEDEDEADEEEE